MRNSMIAYHGSKNFDCGEIDTDYEGRWGSAMFFSFDPSLAREFSRGAELEHICTYEIPHSFSELFNPEDEYAVDALRDCLDTSIENKPLIDDIIENVRNFDWAAFTPSSWIGQEIKTCLQGMGYVGWLEKEDGDDRLNFGLYSAEGVRLLNVEYFCDECDDALSKKEDHTLECEDCNLRLCVECGSEIEWDSDDSEWVWNCMCEDRRENPSHEWFETQSLQNDENGFLINPDTNDIYWYHGNRKGSCNFSANESGMVYLSSSENVAKYFVEEEALYEGVWPTVCVCRVRISGDEIFDARLDDAGNVARDRIDNLHYTNFDYRQDDILGSRYAGYIEVESAPTFRSSTPLTLAVRESNSNRIHVEEDLKLCPHDGETLQINRKGRYSCDNCGSGFRECAICEGIAELPRDECMRCDPPHDW